MKMVSIILFYLSNISFRNNVLYFLNTKLFNNENDNSIVTYFEYSGYKFLFMGDARTDNERIF